MDEVEQLRKPEFLGIIDDPDKFYRLVLEHFFKENLKYVGMNVEGSVQKKKMFEKLRLP